jgi:hypothetical protein
MLEIRHLSHEIPNTTSRVNKPRLLITQTSILGSPSFLLPHSYIPSVSSASLLLQPLTLTARSEA